MTITIELKPEEEQRLAAAAARHQQSVDDYVHALIAGVDHATEPAGVGDANVEDDDFECSLELAAKMADARERLRAAMDADPEFAELARRPLSEEGTVPDEVMDAAHYRKFSDEAFEECYGKELAAELRRQLQAAVCAPPLLYPGTISACRKTDES